MKEIDEEDSLDSDFYQSSSQNDSELNSISEVDESSESYEQASPSKSLLSNNFFGSKPKSMENPMKGEGTLTLDVRVENLENDIKFIKTTL